MSGHGLSILLCWEANEWNSWTPDLRDELRARGHSVIEAHSLADLAAADFREYDVCLPRFRVCAANMAALDDVLVRSGVPMVNGRETRRACEDKGLAHLRFGELGIPQPRSFVLSREGARDRELTWEGETLIKPLHGSRGSGIEILPDLGAALERGAGRGEDLLVQELIWPARSWRVIVGRDAGIVDPYWRRPAEESARVISITGGAQIARDHLSEEGREVATRMLEAVDGDLLAVDLLEDSDGRFFALEINHNFDAHGGTDAAVDAFEAEIRRVARAVARV